MIEFLEIRNFKSIKEYKFELSNLNVVMGLNGMGKSSFVQSILLLRQSRNIKNGELSLNDENIKIGKAQDAFYQYSKTDEISFNIKYSGHKELKFNFAYLPEADYLKTKSKVTESDEVLKNTILTSNFQYLNASRLEPQVIHEKSYRNVVSNRNIGNKGEYTAHFLNEYGSQDVKFDNLIHPNSTENVIEGRKIIDKTLSGQVNYWLSEISPEIRLNTPEIQNSDNILLDFQFRQPNRGYTNNFRPTNVGFGITYALPIITALLAAQPGELIIIENPESHIHPRGQAELGKLVAKVAENDVQIIVETHSDHVLNGIRVGAKEKEISPEKVAIFYFEKQVEDTEQYSKISKILVDNNGELSEYPSNFMSEWSNQLLKLI